MNKTIDNKEQNVMALSAGTMGVSVAITLIPGDTGTTLAEKLSDMSGYIVNFQRKVPSMSLSFL